MCAARSIAACIANCIAWRTTYCWSVSSRKSSLGIARLPSRIRMLVSIYVSRIRARSLSTTGQSPNASPLQAFDKDDFVQVFDNRVTDESLHPQRITSKDQFAFLEDLIAKQ